MQPAYMNMRGHSIRKPKIEVGNIMNTWLKMGMCLHLDLFWLLTQQIEQNRYIVRSQVPDHVNVLAKESQVHALGFDAIDHSQVTAAHQLAQLVDGRIIFKGMAYHQDTSLPFRQGNQLFGFCN